ncbi:hypothetical protein ANO11243_086040 [Dothideomycetidae sp. 11243]|nr:hypothetical protein ANO11243_086040 [fungal sp. No.11243]
MADIPHVSNWVDGVFAEAAQTSIPITNPATEELIATIDATSADQVNAIVKKSWANFHTGAWSRAQASDRFAVLARAADLLRNRMAEFVELETRQTGRPIREMQAQLGRVPEWLDYFASLARTVEGRVTPFKGAVLNTLERLPLGVVVQITPWNHPLLIAIKKIGASLAAGNVVIVKPSELAPLSVLRMGSLFREAGLPDGTLQIVSGYGRDTGKALCSNPAISKIDLTGGLPTYQAIAPVASANLIPITAELGGKAGVCIFPSVAIEDGVRASLFAAFIASGQTCVTGSRILVHQDIYEPFVALLVQRTKALRIGDPTSLSTQVGAVINAAAVERCERFVARARKEGARVLCGGEAHRVDGKGFFFEPTLIETSPGAEVAQEEVFGPVIAVIKCASEEDIIAVANGTKYALGMSIWTNEFKQAHRVANRIDAGLVWINAHHLNDPSSPWGGFKTSGMGKENGREAFESYTKIKSTIMNYGPVPDWFDEGVEAARYG